MQGGRAGKLPVVDGDQRLVGVLSLRDILRYVTVELALDDEPDASPGVAPDASAELAPTPRLTGAR